MRRAKGAETDKSSQQLRAIQSLDIHNKCCLDCGQRGPTYVNMTIGAFVCTKCSGMLRGVTPPHRIKSISMSSFSSEEIDFLRPRGNLWCQKVWLGSHDADLRTLDSMDDEAIKEFIIEKYEKKRYYVDPSTISHLLPQPGPVVPVGVQPEEGTRSNLIGTTLAARLGPGHLRSSTNGFSSVVSRPTNNSTVTQPPNMEAFAAVAKTSTASSNNNKSAGSNLLAAFASPGTDNGSDPFGMSNSTPTTATPSKTKSKSETNDFFADFDAANFETPTTGGSLWSNLRTPLLTTRPAWSGSSFNNLTTNVRKSISKDSRSSTNVMAPKLKPPPGFIPPIFNPDSSRPSPQVVQPSSNNLSRSNPLEAKYFYHKDLDQFSCTIAPPQPAISPPAKVAPSRPPPPYTTLPASQTPALGYLDFFTVPAQQPPHGPNPWLTTFATTDREMPPKLPPRPTITRKAMNPPRKVVIGHDYSNSVGYRLDIEADSTTVEKVLPPRRKLAPKKSNPSLPNISMLATLREELDENASLTGSDEGGLSSMNCLNPFSPYYTPELLPEPRRETNPFRMGKPSSLPTQNPVQLGEDFFSSLFDLTPINQPERLPPAAGNSHKPNPSVVVPVMTNYTKHVLFAAPIPTPQGPTPFGGGGSSWNNTPPFKPSPANPSAKKHQVTRPQSTPITNQSSAADKYAALKDLDDIFRCSVTINDSANNSGSTGVSIFGSSPAPGSKTKSLFEGGGPSLASSVPRASGSIFDTNSSPWSGFNQETTSTTNPTGATWDWGDRNGTANKARASSASGTTSPPPVINPFAATNMSQLNTSPWPTTGTSPVNHPPTSTSGGDSSNWPQASGGSGANGPPPAGFDSDPFATFNLQSGTKPNLGFNSTFKTTDDPFASTDDTNGFSNTQAQGNGNGNFDAFFSSISQSTNQLGVKAEANPWSNPQNDLFTINNPGVGASASGRKSTNPFL